MFENRIALNSLLVLIIFSVGVTTSWAEPSSDASYLGVASCASSNCHGGVSASPVPGILRNEFYTWYKFDKHSRSYNTLLNDESKRIAYHLGISEPHKEKICLDCHATTTESAGEKFRIEDGIGCESCHGASGLWIQSHAERGATHSKNIANGLHDLSSLPKRASLCATCHFGDSNKEVTHRLYGAGHPRLSFELDTFEAVQPRHWKVDADYIDRKTSYRPTQGWAFAQLELARMQIDQLKRHSKPDGLFPEFSQFTCYSCHQSLSSKSFMNRERTSTPGLPRLNMTHLEMVSLILTATNNALAPEWSENIAELKNADMTGDIVGMLENLEGQLTTINLNPSDIQPRPIAAAILRFGASRTGIDQQLAEQLVMALSAANAETSIITKERLKKLYTLVDKPETFNSGYFSTALKSIE